MTAAPSIQARLAAEFTAKLQPADTGVVDLVRWFRESCRVRQIRTMRQFAEQEIIVPDGPYKGQPYSFDVQPWSGLWVDAIDSQRWGRHALVAPTQCGKTLNGSVIPTLYHACECRESVVFGAPDGAMVGDKWQVDLRPVLVASPTLGRLLPQDGPGSRGGRLGTGHGHGVTLANQQMIRFMTGGGDEKSRAAFTTRVVVITETDGLDEAGETSRESSKVEQIEARSMAYAKGGRRRTYLECTASIEDGKIWQEYMGGTRARLALRCPHCRQRVVLEREHLHGWQDARSEAEAIELAHFACPACGAAWSDDERRDSLLECAALGIGTPDQPGGLIMDGQRIVGGEIVGTATPHRTFSLRVSAAENLFFDAGMIGAEEWKATRDTDEDNAERKMRQYWWALPYTPDLDNVPEVTASAVQNRIGTTPRGIVLARADATVAGIDVGLWGVYWTCVCWLEDGSPHVVDYGFEETQHETLGEDRGIRYALEKVHAHLAGGFARELIGGGGIVAGEVVQPSLVLVDSRYKPTAVDQFAIEFSARNDGAITYHPSMGFGFAVHRHHGRTAGAYRAPVKRTKSVPRIGDHYHVQRMQARGVYVVEFDADHWKGHWHDRILTPMDQPGAMTLCRGELREHLGFAKHQAAEQREPDYRAGQGLTMRFVKKKAANHYLDTSALCCVAGHMEGVRLGAGDELEGEAQVVNLAAGGWSGVPMDRWGERGTGARTRRGVEARRGGRSSLGYWMGGS